MATSVPLSINDMIAGIWENNMGSTAAIRNTDATTEIGLAIRSARTIAARRATLTAGPQENLSRPSDYWSNRALGTLSFGTVQSGVRLGELSDLPGQQDMNS